MQSASTDCRHGKPAHIHCFQVSAACCSSAFLASPPVEGTPLDAGGASGSRSACSSRYLCLCSSSSSTRRAAPSTLLALVRLLRPLVSQGTGVPFSLADSKPSSDTTLSPLCEDSSCGSQPPKCVLAYTDLTLLPPRTAGRQCPLSRAARSSWLTSSCARSSSWRCVQPAPPSLSPSIISTFQSGHLLSGHQGLPN